MSRHTNTHRAGVLLTTLVLSACSSLQPSQDERTAQALAVPAQWQENSPTPQQPLTSQLLDLIGDPGLGTLIRQTLAANYDLRQTALRLQEQRLVSHKEAGATLPELNLNLNSDRKKDAATSHALSLDLSWEADVWGRLADRSQAADATTESLELDYRAARDSLAARTIQGWLDIQMRARIINAESQWLNSLEDTEGVIQERFLSGLDGSNSLADLEAARANAALTRASLAARQQNQANAWRQLAALQGTAGTDKLVATLPLSATIPSVSNPPARLPADVLANRPDLQAALLSIDAADALARASHKQLLPSFNLTASLSNSAGNLGDLLSGSTAWSLLGQLTAPLFNAGRLKADAEIADLQAERSYLSYQQALLTAVNEVETALGQETSLAEQQTQLQAAVQHSEASLEHYQARYRSGLNDILDLLTAQQNAFNNRIRLLEIQQARLTNRITLGLALGMGV
ncbi:TolC family protein [Aliamphritea hakodatensis]|uniref:TolC family protein n=1 Tax=Aliamphritea hakodatensis TaxID=2895352 RepID=UPI0022FD699D|nr:TolC family protein [Aliamphritea hakodatensis]